MRKWEYTAVSLSDLDPRVLEVDVLNQLGRDGWELVWITSTGLAYLKRAITPASARSKPQTSK